MHVKEWLEKNVPVKIIKIRSYKIKFVNFFFRFSMEFLKITM